MTKLDTNKICSIIKQAVEAQTQLTDLKVTCESIVKLKFSYAYIEHVFEIKVFNTKVCFDTLNEYIRSKDAEYSLRSMVGDVNRFKERFYSNVLYTVDQINALKKKDSINKLIEQESFIID